MAVFFKKRVLSIALSAMFILLALQGKTVTAMELKETELYSKSCALMDGDSGRILYGKNENLALANASTTKILTCIIALEYGDMDGEAEVSAHAAGQPKVHLGMQAGERFYI